MNLIETVGAVLLLGGSLLTVVAGLGVVRFPDLLARLHAATKPQVLGLILLVVGLGLILRSPAVAFTLLLVVAFQIITGPISAHMLSRAGYRTGQIEERAMVKDELTEDLHRAGELAAEQRGDEADSQGQLPADEQ